MEFITFSPQNKPDVVRVRYNCECGCKPSAAYQKGSAEAGHEHCCCGRVHFVGLQAMERMQQYLEERRLKGEDTDLRYTLHSTTVKAPWGEQVPVAYALPEVPRKH